MREESSWNHRLVTIPIMVMVTAFIVWASVSEVDEIVRGNGRVIPSSQTKMIQHLEGGIIEKIYVKEGQRVKKGDPLYRLKNAKSKADSKKKAITLSALLAKEQRLKAQCDFQKVIRFDKTTDEDFIKSEQAIFQEEMQHFQDDKSALEDKLSQAKLELKQKQQKLANIKREYATAKENLAISKKLLAKGATSKKQYLTELSKTQSLKTQMSDLKSSLPIIKQKISEAQNRLKSFKSEKKSKWLNDLAEVQTKIKQLQEDKSAEADREERKIVTSVVDGIVKKLYFHTIGGVVRPGDRIAEITPVDDKLIIEAKIKSSDRGKVVEGQKVSIAITAYSYTKFGFLEGKLLSISPDSFIEKNGQSYYQVKVEAEKENFAKDKPILPGMIANVNILTGKKTIMRYILKPLKDISINALHEQ